jgi:hypothetical protein
MGDAENNSFSALFRSRGAADGMGFVAHPFLWRCLPWNRGAGHIDLSPAAMK